MKNIIKRLGTLAVLGVVAVNMVLPSSVLAAGATKPREAGGNQSPFDNPSFIGLKAARLMETATPTLLATGPGLLYAICPSGGTLGKYAVAFDSLVAAGISLTVLMADGGKATAYQISPVVYTTNDTTSAQHGMQGCWIPPWPVRFEKALIGANDSNTVRSVFLYRLDGANP